VAIHPEVPSFNVLSDWITARGGHLTLEDVDHVRAPSSGVLIDYRWSVTAFDAGGAEIGQACAEEIEEAAAYICSELGIGAAA
jgi:hypothetical protein